MLSKPELESLTPYGYHTRLLQWEDKGDCYYLLFQFSHESDTKVPFQMDIYLPRPKGPQLFMDGVERTVLMSITECGLKNRTEVLKDLLQQAMERGFSDYLHHGGPTPNGEVVAAEFRALIAKSPLVVDTPTNTPLEKEGYQSMVRIERAPGSPIDPSWREFRSNDWGVIDPASTSQSEKINMVYRFAAEKDHSLSNTLENNGIALSMLPRRHFLLRTALERHLPQVVREDPLVANPKSQVSGKNLLTALMDLGNTTFEDSVAVSQTAAAALTCRRVIRQSWVGHKPLVSVVNVETVVSPNTIVAKTTDGSETVAARKIYYPAKLINVEASHTVKFRKPAWRYIFTYEAYLPLSTGDKMAGRHGNKSIAWVLEDKDMPLVRDPENPRSSLRVDVCLSPYSVIKRRAISLYLEMMLAKKALAEKTTIDLPAWEVPEEYGFKKLVKEGWGDKTQLYLQGHPLPEKTFVAPLYWLRLDKLSSEQASAQKGPVMLNHIGLPIDAARVNGQKRDIAKSLAFYQRGLKELLAHTVMENTLGMQKCEQMIQTLEPGFSFENLVENFVD